MEYLKSNAIETARKIAADIVQHHTGNAELAAAIKAGSADTGFEVQSIANAIIYEGQLVTDVAITVLKEQAVDPATVQMVAKALVRQ